MEIDEWKELAISKIKEFEYQLRIFIVGCALHIDDSIPMKEHKELFEAANKCDELRQLAINGISKFHSKK